MQPGTVCSTVPVAFGGMHWSLLLVVASSMGNEENLQFLTRAPARTHVLSCDVFLAPSTIPGSECMRTETNETTKLCMLCGLLAALQIFVS